MDQTDRRFATDPLERLRAGCRRAEDQPAVQGTGSTHTRAPEMLELPERNPFADLFETVKASQVMLAICLLGVIWLLISMALSLDVLPR